MRYLLSIDYDEPDSKTYRGVVIYDSEKDEWEEVVRVNTGSPQLDEKRALRKFHKLIDNAVVYYLSSYDHYFMDFDYDNDPKVKAEVDKMVEEQEEKIRKYKKRIGKEEDDDLTTEEWNYIINRRDDN